MFCAFAFWELWPCGLLHRLPLGTLKPAGPPRPALVVPRPKPKSAWLRADDDFDDTQRALAREDWQEIEKAVSRCPRTSLWTCCTCKSGTLNGIWLTLDR